MISIKKASDLLGISQKTLRTWDGNGKLIAVRTKGNHRRYKLSDIQKFQGVYHEEVIIDSVAVYCRVSSNEQKQKGDLDRQKGRVLDYAIKKKYKVEYAFDEVGSGMNDNRSKLHQLFKLVSEHKICKVVIEHKDRLTRFNFLVYQEFFKSHDVEIECMESVFPKSYEAELVEDILSLMSSFSAKIYGKRSSENRKKKKNEVATSI